MQKISTPMIVVLTMIGYTYDYLGPDNLASSQAYVENSQLGLPQYQALIFINQTVASVAAVEAMVKMASKGLPIVFVGPPLTQSYPADARSQSALDSAVGRLLSSANVYRVNSVDQLPALLAERKVAPRIGLSCASNPIYSVWRSSVDVDFVYLFNDQSRAAECTATIMASGVIPYIYNSWTGSQSQLVQYTAKNSSLSIPLSLKANESLVLGLHRSTEKRTCTIQQTAGNLRSLNVSAGNIEAIISGSTTLSTSSGNPLHLNASLPPPTNLTSWNLVLEDWHSAPDRYAVQTEISNHTFRNISLVPWNQLSTQLNPVSGIGHYTTRFTVPRYNSSSSPLVGILKLPLVQHTARAFLDEEWLGPIDPINPVISLQNLKNGREYELRIEVATTLFNRIKAEANQTWIVGQVAGVRQPKYNTLPYEKYGLVGNVVLEWGEVHKVEC